MSVYQTFLSSICLEVFAPVQMGIRQLKEDSTRHASWIVRLFYTVTTGPIYESALGMLSITWGKAHVTARDRKQTTVKKPAIKAYTRCPR